MRVVFLLLFFLGACTTEQQTPVETEASFAITFGSCNKQYKDQPLWNTILKNNPDLWIWLGDVIYADTADMTLMKERYEQQLSKKSYLAFCGKVPVIGVWDDHDYGVNNGGKEYKSKAKSQQLFLDFIGEPKNSLRRKQQGIYWAYNYQCKTLKIKVILLDTRYHREQPGRDADILGEKQWLWLDKELQNSKADLHIICSSIQVISATHRFEKWANFPKARKRLFKIVKNVRGVIFLSGDRHFAEISQIQIHNHPVYEVTASGMTHNASIPLSILRKENKKFRISDCFNRKHFGMIVVDEKNKFLHLQIRDKNNQAVLQKRISFAKLGVGGEK